MRVSLLGVAAVPEGLGLVAATVAASVALVSMQPRRRAWAMLAALVLAALALVPQVHSKVTERPALAAAGAVAGFVVVVIGAWLFVRRPAALGLLALAALPFRIPVSVGGTRRACSPRSTPWSAPAPWPTRSPGCARGGARPGGSATAGGPTWPGCWRR